MRPLLHLTTLLLIALAAPGCDDGERGPPPVDESTTFAVGGGFVWVQRSAELVRVDPGTGRDPRVGALPDYASEVAAGEGALWLLDTPTQDPESDDEPPWALHRIER